jgi:2-C-methyl-D-erythritol 4-phosphate cytidylyltransferase
MADVVAALAAGAQAVIPVLPVVDTIARVVDDEVLGNVPRDEMRLVQTPQGFDLDVLRRAHNEAPAGLEATDDASLVSRLGIAVRAVPGHPLARKVTTPEDLTIIGALLSSAAPEAAGEAT